MSKKVSAEVEAFKREMLAERLALCTEAQRATFALAFPGGVPSPKLESAIDLCDRTIAANAKKPASADPEKKDPRP